MNPSIDLNPQLKQMADESMVRNLDAQARAIWPQEKQLIRRYELPQSPRILDAGCGTGEGARRFAEYFPGANVLGVDIIDAHLELARARSTALAPRLSFEHRSIFDLELPKGTFDLVVCRHVLQSIPQPEKVLAELVRVTRPGGLLHLIPEDYGMIHFGQDSLDLDRFWTIAPREFGESTRTDFHIGRHIWGHLSDLGLEEIVIDYVVVDPVRVSRETVATIIEAWRDGFSAAIGQSTSYSEDQARAHFDAMIAQIRDPRRYFVWMVPVVSARVPKAHGD
jgi:SAM-dependent methyltransferase